MKKLIASLGVMLALSSCSSAESVKPVEGLDGQCETTRKFWILGVRLDQNRYIHPCDPWGENG